MPTEMIVTTAGKSKPYSGLAQEWADYHLKNAVLRVVHKTCNLKRQRA